MAQKKPNQPAQKPADEVIDTACLTGSTVTAADIDAACPALDEAVAHLVATEDAAIIAAIVEPVVAEPVIVKLTTSRTVLVIASNVCATYENNTLVRYTTAPLDLDALYSFFKLTPGPQVAVVNVKIGSQPWNVLVDSMIHTGTPPTKLEAILGE